MSRKLLGFPHVEHTELYCEAQQWLAMHFVIAFWLATSMVVGKNYDPFRIWSRSLFMAVNLKPHRTHQVLRVQHQLQQQTEEERLAKKWGWVGNKSLFRCCYVFACCNEIAAANKQMIMSPPPTQFTVIANAIYEYGYYYYIYPVLFCCGTATTTTVVVIKGLRIGDEALSQLHILCVVPLSTLVHNIPCHAIHVPLFISITLCGEASIRP